MTAKQAAGEKAAEWVKDGMIVGLGTGSTARWAIAKIGELVADGIKIQAVPTSVQSATQAKDLGIPLVELNAVDRIDVTIDGADEIDPQFDMIKGGGGALLREKLVAAASDVEVIVADPSKTVEVLGRKFLLPVEVVPFGWRRVERRLRELGGVPALRQTDGKPYETDNGNVILDAKFEEIADPASLEQALNMIPGVVENGLFVELAHVLIVGHDDGTTEVQRKRM